MAKRDKISMSVIRRLPRYYRFLGLLEASGVVRISSKELAARMGVNASQIRQDFNCFGEFGQQGYGYIVSQLRQTTGEILGLNNAYKAVVIGAGNLGRAIVSHISFERHGFYLAGVFDSAPSKIGTYIHGIQVLDAATLETFCLREKPVIAALCVPTEAAGNLTETLHRCGVVNFWNFTHYDIAMQYGDVTVENVHLNDSLMTLCYRISHPEKDAGK